MKSFILACVAALTTAEITEGTKVDIAQIENNGVKSSGVVQEVMADDGTFKTITIAMGW